MDKSEVQSEEAEVSQFEVQSKSYNICPTPEHFIIVCYPCKRLEFSFNLIMESISHGSDDMGLAIYFRSISELEKDSSCAHKEVSRIINALMLQYLNRNNCAEAVKLANYTLEIQKTSMSDHDMTMIKTTIASLLNLLEVYKQLETLYKRFLESQQHVLGENHIVVARQRRRLGMLSQNQGKYEEAEFYYKRALKTYERASLRNTNAARIARLKNHLINCHLMKKRKGLEW